MDILSFLKCKPALFDKYEKNLIVATNKLESSMNINTGVAKLLYIAKCDCIDSYVNLFALQKVISTLMIPLEINIINDDIINQFNIHETPTILFFNDSNEEITRWSRVPKVIKEIESSGDQIEIIREKRAYRNGQYLEYTLNEINNILKSI